MSLQVVFLHLKARSGSSSTSLRNTTKRRPSRFQNSPLPSSATIETWCRKSRHDEPASQRMYQSRISFIEVSHPLVKRPQKTPAMWSGTFSLTANAMVTPSPQDSNRFFHPSRNQNQKTPSTASPTLKIISRKCSNQESTSKDCSNDLLITGHPWSHCSPVPVSVKSCKCT